MRTVHITDAKITGYASYYSTQTQTAAAINTAYPVNFDQNPMNDGNIRLVDGNKFYIDNDGPYNMSFSLQLESSNNSTQTVDVWVKYNGENYPWSNTKVNVIKGPNVAAWNIFGESIAGGYVQLMWSSSSTDVSIKQYDANSIHPAVPSAIITFNRLNEV